ncbi:MAG: SEC-C metal-binding domain-containing protein, partial [Methyloceanibacter sp.]
MRYRGHTPKVKPNEPCYCGSGKKLRICSRTLGRRRGSDRGKNLGLCRRAAPRRDINMRPSEAPTALRFTLYQLPLARAFTDALRVSRGPFGSEIRRVLIHS